MKAPCTRLSAYWRRGCPSTTVLRAKVSAPKEQQKPPKLSDYPACGGQAVVGSVCKFSPLIDGASHTLTTGLGRGDDLLSYERRLGAGDRTRQRSTVNANHPFILSISWSIHHHPCRLIHPHAQSISVYCTVYLHGPHAVTTDTFITTSWTGYNPLLELWIGLRRKWAKLLCKWETVATIIHFDSI